jgi:hypothetical protein
MDNRIDGGADEPVSSPPPTGMPGFKPLQSDRSGTENFGSHLNQDTQATDANSTPHSGGTGFHSFGSQESGGPQSGGPQSGGPQSRGSQSSYMTSSDRGSSDSMADASKWTATRDRVMQTLRRNPMPLALGIAGVATAIVMSIRNSRGHR